MPSESLQSYLPNAFSERNIFNSMGDMANTN